MQKNEWRQLPNIDLSHIFSYLLRKLGSTQANIFWNMIASSETMELSYELSYEIIATVLKLFN